MHWCFFGFPVSFSNQKSHLWNWATWDKSDCPRHTHQYQTWNCYPTCTCLAPVHVNILNSSSFLASKTTCPAYEVSTSIASTLERKHQSQPAKHWSVPSRTDHSRFRGAIVWECMGPATYEPTMKTMAALEMRHTPQGGELHLLEKKSLPRKSFPAARALKSFHQQRAWYLWDLSHGTSINSCAEVWVACHKFNHIRINKLLTVTNTHKCRFSSWKTTCGPCCHACKRYYRCERFNWLARPQITGKGSTVNHCCIINDG